MLRPVFQDRAHIHVTAGRGGDGGRGGDVVLLADAALRDLSQFRSKRSFKAGRGGPGRGALKHGADGETVMLRVPVGTQVLDDEGRPIADLARPEARYVAARGGAGGRGNKRFATATRQTPRFAETGLPGGEAELRLQLLPRTRRRRLRLRELQARAVGEQLELGQQGTRADPRRDGVRLPHRDARVGARRAGGDERLGLPPSAVRRSRKSYSSSRCVTALITFGHAASRCSRASLKRPRPISICARWMSRSGAKNAAPRAPPRRR